MTDPYRLLVTGSRDWDDLPTIGQAIEQAILDSGRQPILVIHGACRLGADQQAGQYARWLQGRGCAIDVEPHPAQNHPTEDFGPWPAAGPRRNAHMVRLGADLTLAFISPCTKPNCRRPQPHGSHGASNCADLAEQAGIPVRRITP
jgi:hypothetical protein